MIVAGGLYPLTAETGPLRGQGLLVAQRNVSGPKPTRAGDLACEQPVQSDRRFRAAS